MDFGDLLERNAIKSAKPGQHHHARSGWIQIDCFQCSPDSGKFRLGINLRRNYANCWRCGSVGMIAVIRHVCRCDAKEAKRLFESLNGSSRPLEVPARGEGRLVLPKNLGELAANHEDYLINRNFNPETICRLWGIKGIGIHPRLAHRIWIPITYMGRVVSWTTRSISPRAENRYVSANRNEEILYHKSLLYGMDYCRSTIIIVEGPTDVWNVGPGAGGTFGVGYKRAQILKMLRFPRRAVCFDSSDDAQKRAEELCAQLQDFPGETCNVTLDAEDPGSASKKEIRLLRKSFGLD